MGPGTLTEILASLPVFTHPDLLVSGSKMDDAGVYRLTPDLALIQTVDFLTPMVDDPYSFGQVAAANALSDVYAMGGKPLTAMNIAAFPVNTMDTGILREILSGGADKIKEAGALLVGGHTIEDKEPKYGLSVTGTARPEQVVTNQGAQPGDCLVLTKPLGTGIITTALKGGAIDEKAAAGAIASMAALNNRAAQMMVAQGAHAATDITGFGLLGHAYEISSASGTGLEINMDQIPAFGIALELARSGRVPGGLRRNQRYLEDKVRWEGAVLPEERDLLHDPQTSGGLLIAVPGDRLAGLVDGLVSQGVLAAAVGRVTDGDPGWLTVIGR